MYAETALPFANTTPSFPGFNDPVAQPEGPVAVSRLVKSVVEEAGLGRFVYLKGCSGRRYIFSAIRCEQVELYRHALFATTRTDGSVKICNTPSRAEAGNQLYVHLLDDDADLSTILDDLKEASPINA